MWTELSRSDIERVKQELQARRAPVAKPSLTSEPKPRAPRVPRSSCIPQKSSNHPFECGDIAQLGIQALELLRLPPQRFGSLSAELSLGGLNISRTYLFHIPSSILDKPTLNQIR